MMLIQLTDDLRTALDIESQNFYRQFGRYPTREDPAFWDPSIESDTPHALTGMLLRSYVKSLARQVGYPPAEIFAVQKLSRYSKEERTQELHDEAVADYLNSCQLKPSSTESQEWPGLPQHPLPRPRVHDDDDDIPW